MTFSFYALRQLFNTAQTHPQKIAVVLDDQAWTYSELIEQVERVACHLHRLDIAQGQIIYQFVERSFEMICGLLGIMCSGGVYCPVNPTDPAERILSVLEQIHGQYVLLHERTRKQFPIAAVRQVILLEEIVSLLAVVEDIGDIPDCRECGAALIMYTSGTTGRQKAIIHTHKSFSGTVSACAEWHLGVYTFRDQVLQMATCSWILHLREILLPLVLGGTLVLLRPSGHLDTAYLCRTLLDQQVTTLIIGSGIIRALTNYLDMSQRLETFKFVRSLVATGETVKPQQWARFMTFLSSSNARVFIQYGLTECSGIFGYQLLDIVDPVVPIGYPLPGVQCLLIDEQGQTITNTGTPNDIGQIHIAGPALFNCYLDDPERTANVLVTIGNQVYMKTGDLAQYNARGELVHVGRIDFQIKVRGQRVEVSEIENTIMNWSSSKVSNCLVTKVSENDDLLVAYIISNDLELDTRQIRDYCNRHLRQYMVPSYFIVLDKFPLNANGKVDRKKLPLPSLRYDASTNFVPINDTTISELEEKVHSLWCSTLRLDAVPRHMNCFALGGSSLTLIEFFNYYQVCVTPDKQLNVADFFINPTIAEHVQLLVNSKTKTSIIWTPLHLVQGRASYAQESIWLAERTRFIQQTPSVPPYNMTSIYGIDSGHFSIKQCLRAIDSIIDRHMVFHTRFIFNCEYGYLEQSIIDTKSYDQRPYQVNFSTIQSAQEFKALGYQETLMPLVGGVFRCHFVRYDHNNEDILKQGDFIMFTFHHGSFDRIAMNIFLKEFSLEYSGTYDLQQPFLQYIDYATYERSNMDMNAGKDYWREALRDYYWDRQLDLPYDFGASSDVRRSGRCWFLGTHVPTEITDAMITRAKELEVTLLQLTLTCFYIFLAQISPHNQDACVTIPIQNRYRPELENIIGMFANMLPCRVVFDASSASTVTVVDLLRKVQNNLTNMIKYGNIPYLELLELHRIPSLNLQFPFLHAYFTLITSMDNDYLDSHQINLIESSSNQNSCSLSQCFQLEEPGDETIFVSPSMFDTDITVFVDIAQKKTDFWWKYSTDLFTHTTIDMLSKQFVRLLGDLFVAIPFQELHTTPLVKLISMANEPMNLLMNNRQKQLDRTAKVLTLLEKQIQTIYSRVLDTDQIDLDRSFFEQGGTSLKALHAIYLLQENPMTVTIDANLFFANPSVIGLAQTIEARR